MNWYLKCFKQYADFKGRARRTEFWMFTLIHLIILFSLAGIVMFVENNIDPYYYDAPVDENAPLSSDDILAIWGLIASVFFIIYSIISIVPSIAVSVRRAHDVGKSGWYTIFFYPSLILILMLLDVDNLGFLLIKLSPVFYTYIIYNLVQEGDSRANKYGEDPKKVDFE